MASRLHWLWLLATPPIMAAGCHSIFGIDEYEVAPSAVAGSTAAGGSGAQSAGGTGAGASGGSVATGGSAGTGGSGASGGGQDCTSPSQCPGTDTTCQSRTCVGNVCGVSPAPADTPCAETDGTVCDGDGACVECNAPDDCPTQGDLCAGHLCVSAQCVDDQQNGSETDVDCGGEDCPPCENGLDCLLFSDCDSQFCSAQHVCSPCTSDGNCATATGTWCDLGGGGSCVPKLALGVSCARDAACTSGFCPADDDICCNEACDGVCVACLGSKTGGTNGSCEAVTANTDPEDECFAGSGPCTAAGTGCNGVDNAPNCNLQTCTCAALFPMGGAILQSCGPTAEGCDVRVNSTMQNCALVCQSHGSECVGSYNDIPSGTCTRDLSDPLLCTQVQFQSVLCLCTLGCGGGPACESPAVCTNGECV